MKGDFGGIVFWVAMLFLVLALGCSSPSEPEYDTYHVYYYVYSDTSNYDHGGSYPRLGISHTDIEIDRQITVYNAFGNANDYPDFVGYVWSLNLYSSNFMVALSEGEVIIYDPDYRLLGNWVRVTIQ